MCSYAWFRPIPQHGPSEPDLPRVELGIVMPYFGNTPTAVETPGPSHVINGSLMLGPDQCREPHPQLKRGPSLVEGEGGGVAPPNKFGSAAELNSCSKLHLLDYLNPSNNDCLATSNERFNEKSILLDLA